MGQFNRDELEPPTWMDKEFFEKILKKSEADNGVQILSYKITPATLMGDHYASVMFRACIKFKSSDQEEKEKSLIIKTMPVEEGAKKEMFKDSKIFETEIGIYNTLGKFEDELRKYGDQTVLGTKMLYASLDPVKIIVLEDLTKLGYETLHDRQTNMEEAKMAITKLAKWHAISYKLKLEGDDSLTNFRDHIFNIPNIKEVPFFADGLGTFIDVLKKYPEFEDYVWRFQKLSDEDLIQRCVDLFNNTSKAPDCHYLVLNHGDFHAKNMMFKRSKTDGNWEDVMLLDFQACSWGPAAADLIYMLFMLFDPVTRLEKRDEIIHFYHTKFVETLQKTGFKGRLPKLTELHMDMIKYKDLEIFNYTTLAGVIPYFYGEYGPNFDVDKTVHANREDRVKLFDKPRFIEDLRRTLPIYLRRGYLD